MNERQRERRRRFAAMRARQERQAQSKADSHMHQADVVVGKTPRGPWGGDASRNQHHKTVTGMFSQAGTINVEHRNKHGELIGIYEVPNGITNEGLNNNLNVYFDSGTQITAWYCGLINLTGYSALDPTDTYDDIDQAGNGWDTFQSYTDANNTDSATTRPEWPPDAASGQSITNTTTKAIFDITAGGTVKGIFICGGTNAQTKGDHTAAGNVLWSTALFSGGDVAVSNGDQLKVTYTVNASTS